MPGPQRLSLVPCKSPVCLHPLPLPQVHPCPAHQHPPMAPRSQSPLLPPLQRGCSIQLWDEGVNYLILHSPTPVGPRLQPAVLLPHGDLTVTSPFAYVPRQPELPLPNKGSHLPAPSEFCQTPCGVGATRELSILFPSLTRAPRHLPHSCCPFH